MQVLLLATGESPKLVPLTLTLPAPMVPIANRPIMAHNIELLARQGVKHITVAVYDRAGYVEAYFENGSRWGVELDYVLQREPWGSAGSLKWAESIIQETVLVIPADILIDIDIWAVLEAHQKNQNLITIAVHPCGQGEAQRLYIGPEGEISCRLPDLSGQPLGYNTGVYCLEPELLERIPSRTCFDIHTDLLPTLLKDGVSIGVYTIEDYWNPLESINQYHEAQLAFLYDAWQTHTIDDQRRMRFYSLAGKHKQNGVWIGRNPVIHPSARITPPVLIGENCRIGKSVELGPDVVVGDNVIIDDEATVVDSVIMPQSYLGRFVNVDKRVIVRSQFIDIPTAQSIEIVDRFLLSEVDEGVVERSLKRWLSFSLAAILFLLALPILVVLVFLAWVASRRIFSPEICSTTQSKSKRSNGASSANTFRLWRFATRRMDGQINFGGRFLERWELDRLPELINVLKGDLMIVGVKPLTLHEINQITEPWQQRREESMPGFTGLWYTRTLPGCLLEEILVNDAFYVATRTWRSDLRLLWETPAAWFRRARSMKSA